MNTKVTMDRTMRTVSNLTERLLFSLSCSTLNRLAPRLRTINPSSIAIVILAKSMISVLAGQGSILPHLHELST